VDEKLKLAAVRLFFVLGSLFLVGRCAAHSPFKIHHSAFGGSPLNLELPTSTGHNVAQLPPKVAIAHASSARQG